MAYNASRGGAYLAVAVVIVTTLTWLTLRHAHRDSTGGGRPRGPSEIIMSQVLSQAIPLWLAGHRRSEVLPEKLVRRAMEALGGESPSLLRACGARFGDPEQITLWIGSTLGARDARQIVEDLRLKVSSRSTDFSTDAIESDSMLVRAVGPRGELAIFAIGERVYWVQAESAQMDSALTELRPWQ